MVTSLLPTYHTLPQLQPNSSMKSAAFPTTTTIIIIFSLHHPSSSPIIEARTDTRLLLPGSRRVQAKSFVSRGGDANNLDAVIDDDKLDHLVDELISDLNDSDADVNIDESDEDEIDEGGGRAADSSAPSARSLGNDDQENDEDESDEQNMLIKQLEDDVKELRSARPVSDDASTASSTIHFRSGVDDLSDARSSTLSSRISTPTNAFYRFVVQRGPAGHLLASFTLVAVQFIYTYIPFLYQTVASILLRLHIYDPRVLYEKDQQRQMRTINGRQTKQQGGRGLASKLFGKSSRPLKQHRAIIQKQADQVAATTLKQLYRTMKIGNGLGKLSEIKYRYLSLAFQRKYGLGKEYRIEKPRTFMGEVVDGNYGGNDFTLDEENMEDLVIPDNYLDVVETGDSSDKYNIIMSSTRGDRSLRRRGRQSKQSLSTGKIPNNNDWVLQAFASHQRPQTSANRFEESSNFLEVSSLWKSVNRAAIIDAARESIAVDQSFTMQKDRVKNSAEVTSHENDGINDMRSGDVSGGGFNASKVFQSVMTRVGGSSGRIFGAYPNDAPPIEQCAHKRGVLSLARRYGYGNWKVQHQANPYSSRSGQQDFDETIQQDDDDDIEDNNDDSWGGGNLI